ncbi:hypothetical protein B0H14DRAFT_2815801 [Mycena olivaceomarginata]|nr:hypothetical protein B0H14DRAFT_2815801 [Mycena olivaceomarginata]
MFMTLTQRFEFISSAAAAILGLYSTPILLRSALYTMAKSRLRLVADFAARPAPSFIQEGNRGRYVPRFLPPVELRVLDSSRVGAETRREHKRAPRALHGRNPACQYSGVVSIVPEHAYRAS